jgi:hypothetical protein
MVDELVGPGEEEVRLVPQVAVDRRARLLFVGLEAGAVSARLGGAQDADGVDAAVAPEVGDLSLGEVHEPTISVICQGRQTAGRVWRGRARRVRSRA